MTIEKTLADLKSWNDKGEIEAVIALAIMKDGRGKTACSSLNGTIPEEWRLLFESFMKHATGKN